MTMDSESSSEKQAKCELWIPNNLKVVCEAIDKECEIFGRNFLKNEFIALLQTLNYVERSFVAHYFSHLPWNISSVRVLGCLNRLRILTATEYILSQTDEEHVQLVLNDFLEAEFDLMANLIICGHFDLMCGSKITEYIDEGIRRLFSDLAKDPQLNNLEYLHALKDLVPRDLHSSLVTNHLKIILAMHKNQTRSAFQNFSNWTQENLDDLIIVHNFYNKAIAGNDQALVKNLLNISSGANFMGWRNYLIILGLITKNCPAECRSFIRKWLKDRLKVVAESGSREIMAHLLLSIRVVFLFEDDKTETYAKWYKQYIGDMKFIFNANEFQTMIAVLTDLVAYETEEEYLQVHVKVSISPPVMCGQICRDYKTLCRTRMADIVDGARHIDSDEDLFPDIK